MFLATHGILRSSSIVPFADTHSFEYDGVLDYLTMGNVLPTSGSGSSELSLSCWFKTSAGGRLITRARATNFLEGYNLFITSSGQLRFYIGQYTGNASSSPWIYIRTTSTWDDNNWHNVVLTYSGNQNTSGLKMYIDGSLESTTSLYNNTPIIGTSNTDLVIGAQGYSSDTFGGHFNGLIDEPAIFDYELTTSDVSTIYGSGVATDISSLNPEGWWRSENATFNGSVWTVTDSGYGGNNSVSNSMTTSSKVSDVPT